MLDGRIIQPGDAGWMPPPRFPSRTQLRRWERERRWTPVRIYRLPNDRYGRERWRIEEEFYVPVPRPGWHAVVAYNSDAGTAVQGTTSPTSDNFTVGAGANLCGFAPLAFNNASGGLSISGVTWNVVPASACGTQSQNTDSNFYSQVWQLVNPATGTHTLAVTVVGSLTDIYRNFLSYTGVDQTTPVRAGTYFQDTGSVTTDGSGNYSKAITSQVGDMTLTCVNGGSAGNITTNKSLRGSNGGGACSFAHDDASGAATVTHVWSGGGASSGLSFCGFSIAAVAPIVLTEAPPQRGLDVQRRMA